MPGNQFSGNGELDFAVGSVQGARWWSLEHGNPVVLKGVYGLWEPGENKAICLANNCVTRHTRGEAGHRAPAAGCSCGYWAYWEVLDTRRRRQVNAEIPVLGVVEGYGKTQIGDKGFRCEKAKILALHITLPTSERASPGKYAYPPRQIRGLGEPAIATWYRMTGHAQPPSDSELFNAEEMSDLEAALGSYYRVPVYASARAMLAIHPTTRDYLPAHEEEPQLTVQEP